MPKTKDISRTTQKWQQNTSQASGSYADGVQTPKTDWAQATMAAQDNYKTAVVKAANENRFGRGVQKAGTAKQQQNALTKGVQRFSQGVAVATPDYQQSMEGVLRTIESTVLPPRKPKGDPTNIDRVKTMAAALSAYKRGTSK